MTRDELLIEASELASIIDKPDLRLFDATVLLNPQAGESGLSRYNDGHLPGAAFLDHLAISKQQASPMFMLPGEAELATAIGNLGIDNNSDVVIYSTDSIMWATRAWWVLRYAGHTRVRVLDGGRSGWQGKLDTNPYQYTPTNFEPNLTPAMIADKEEVLASINNGATCTINA